MAAIVEAGTDRWAGMPGALPGDWVPDPLPDHLVGAGYYGRVLAHQRVCNEWGCTCDRQGWAFQVLHAHSMECPLNPYVGSTLGAGLIRDILLGSQKAVTS